MNIQNPPPRTGMPPQMGAPSMPSPAAGAPSQMTTPGAPGTPPLGGAGHAGHDAADGGSRHRADAGARAARMGQPMQPGGMMPGGANFGPPPLLGQGPQPQNPNMVQPPALGGPQVLKVKHGQARSPAPPNPVDTARASTSTNVGTSIANAFLNNTNQITPDGSLRYDVDRQLHLERPLHRARRQHPDVHGDADAVAAAAGDPRPDRRRQVQHGGHGEHAVGPPSPHLLPHDINLGDAPAAGDANGSATSRAVDGVRCGRAAAAQSRRLRPAADRRSATPATSRSSYGPRTTSAPIAARVEDALYGRLNPQLSASAPTSSSGWPTRASATARRPTHRRWTTTTGRPTTRGSA